eukprot:7254404-Alexandrium_andersonii.AAC.1
MDSPESLASWLGAETAQDLPVMMGTPPDVTRTANAQLGVGRALPGSFTCAFLRRSVLRNLLAGLP